MGKAKGDMVVREFSVENGDVSLHCKRYAANGRAQTAALGLDGDCTPTCAPICAPTAGFGSAPDSAFASGLASSSGDAAAPGFVLLPDEGPAPSSVTPPGRRPPLLLIHGGCTDSSFFDASAPLLAAFFDVVSYDRRGSGRSSRPEGGDFSVAAQAEDARAVARAAFSAPCFVIAHSAGAVVGMRLASEHPEAIRRILLFEPPAVDSVPADDSMRANIVSIYRGLKRGTHAGDMGRGFMFGLSPKDDRAPEMSDAEREFAVKNTRTSVREETDVLFREIPDYAALSRVDVAVCASELARTAPLGVMARAFAEKLGAPLLHFPGAHNCPRDLPFDFAAMAIGALLLPTLS